MVDIKEINNLYERLVGINTWIVNNKDVKEPNYYEIMDCSLMVGDIFSRLKNYEGRTIDEEIILAMASYKLQLELTKMIELRDLTNHPFIKENEEVSSLLFHTINACLSGDLTHFEDRGINDARNNILKKCVSVPFYIWQVRQNDNNYMYDNDTEFDEIIGNYAVFSGYCAFNLETLGTDDHQLLNEMRIVIKQIGNNYKYNNKDKVMKKSDDLK